VATAAEDRLSIPAQSANVVCGSQRLPNDRVLKRPYGSYVTRRPLQACPQALIEAADGSWDHPGGVLGVDVMVRQTDASCEAQYLPERRRKIVALTPLKSTRWNWCARFVAAAPLFRRVA
jgi:hypothetical protein